MMDLFHILTLVLYCIIIVTVTGNLHTAMVMKKGVWVKWSIVASLCLGTQASIFIALQVDWVFNSYDDQISDWSSLGWLMFDYFNGAALLAFAKGNEALLKWGYYVDSKSYKWGS